MMQSKIVPLCAAHIPRLAELEMLCFTTPWSADAFHEDLCNPLAQYFIMEQNGVVTGYVGSRIVLDEVYITNVAVAPDCRQKGIGEMLICALLEAARARGTTQIMLEVRASNAPAIALYSKFGFSPNGMRKNYYDTPTEDAILMNKII